MFLELTFLMKLIWKSKRLLYLIQREKKVKKQVSIIVIVIGILSLGCDTNTHSSLSTDLVCQITVDKKQPCSEVLSLKSGEIRIQPKDKTFSLTAQYNACYQDDRLKVTGEYEFRTYESSIELELLSTKITTTKGNRNNFPRTIGLLRLDKKTLQGHFIDIWAVIRTQTKPINDYPLVAVNCVGELPL